MRILIGAPVRRKPRILAEFLAGLDGLDRCGHDVDFVFCDDNDDPAASAMLRSWDPSAGRAEIHVAQGLPEQRYDSANDWHHWNAALAGRVAVLRNHLIEVALQRGYDALIQVDSDLVLAPDTIHWLAGAGKDICIEVFWTEFFRTDTGERSHETVPNCWLWGECGLFPKAPGEETLTQREARRRMHKWFAMMRQPGVYEIGGGGACTWMSRRTMEAGVDYRPVHNLGWWGEDRFFQVRAAVAGIPMFADTHCPPLHLYRDSMLRQLGPWRARTARRMAEEVVTHAAD